MSDDGAPAPEQPVPEQNSLRRTLDLFVFAPVGMALTALEDLPGLVAKGRERVETEISNARVVGKFVVDRGLREVTSRFAGLPPESLVAGAEAAEDAEAAFSDTGDSGEAAPLASSDAVEISVAASALSVPLTAPRPAPDPADGVLVEQALADYDTLSASQVVRRLESLGPDVLRAVHRHEASHRNRRTILNRTSQLLGDSGSTPVTAAE